MDQRSSLELNIHTVKKFPVVYTRAVWKVRGLAAVRRCYAEVVTTLKTSTWNIRPKLNLMQWFNFKWNCNLLIHYFNGLLFLLF
jgi:hypothetical protein